MRPDGRSPLARSLSGFAPHALLCALVFAALPRTGAAQDLGVWDPPVAWPMVAVHLLHQPDGEILSWAYNGTSARLWNPDTGAFTAVPTAHNIFCSGHAAIAKDGRYVVAGGISNNSTQIFDWVNDVWITGQDMAFDRFYPTLTTLPDNRVIALSGSGGGQPIPEVYDPAHDTWTQIPNANFLLPLYPFMFLLPNGQLFFSGPGTDTYSLNLVTETWSFVDASINDGASAVMLRPGVVMKCGSFSGASKTTEVINLNLDNPQWVQVGDMAFERHDHNLTLLPDGTVLTTGGHDSGHVSVLEAELFNPATGTWKTLAPMVTPRRYHSTAQLLQDGRVLSAGGDGFPSAEIFHPPYLFAGARPKIFSAPGHATWGQELEAKISNKPKIEQVSLLRLGAVTHSFDHNQRFIPLKFDVVYSLQPAPTGGPAVQPAPVPSAKLITVIPDQRTVVPPGAYLLFIVSEKGAPSVGHYLQVN